MKITNLFLLLMCALSLGANEPLIQKKKVPLDIALPLLQSIDKYSIHIGEGTTHMYAFIDPMCPRSRDFVEMVVENKNMQELYTYHFFLYELQRFHTKSIIADILGSDNAMHKMEDIMVKKEKPQETHLISKNIQIQMDKISNIAEQLDIDKRPYLFVVKPKKEDK